MNVLGEVTRERARELLRERFRQKFDVEVDDLWEGSQDASLDVDAKVLQRLFEDVVALSVAGEATEDLN
jgi:hypothetical protein